MKKEDHDHDQGLAHDLKTLTTAALGRRQALLALVGASLATWLGCGGSSETSTGSTSTSSSGGGTGTGTGTCAEIPDETGGPYPGDGTNGPNVLTASGIVRGDITSSFGAMSGTAAGIPLTIKLTIVNSKASCAPLAAYAVYLWHCDRDGNYSLYTVAEENYLRGVQETDSDGTVTFTSIFPACYSGRWPHVHFEIFSSLASATAAGSKVKTSQFAMPEDACADVFATAGYEQSVTNLQKTSLTSDMVFSDGATLETPSITGNVTDGYELSLTVAVPA